LSANDFFTGSVILESLAVESDEDILVLTSPAEFGAVAERIDLPLHEGIQRSTKDELVNAVQCDFLRKREVEVLFLKRQISLILQKSNKLITEIGRYSKLHA